MCDKVRTEMMTNDKEGVNVDFGDATLLQTKAILHILSKAKLVPHKSTETKCAPTPIIPTMVTPKKIKKAEFNGIVVEKKNINALLANHVPMETLSKEGIGMTELRQEEVSIHKFAMVYGWPLERYVQYIQGTNKWATMLDMGLKWTHLKDKVLFSPAVLAREIMPTTDQFLSLLMTGDELKDGYGPVVQENDLLLRDEILEKKYKRELGAQRLFELEYTAEEMIAFGITPDLVTNILGADPYVVEKRFQTKESGSRTIVGPPIVTKNRIFGNVEY